MSAFRSVLIKANIFAVDRLPDHVVDKLVVRLPDYVVDSLPDFVIDRLPDYAAVNVQYFRRFRKFPNLKSPETFNEKIAWRKLYQRNPKFPLFSDKIAAKAEVARLIGEQHIVKTLWAGDTPESIPFDKLEPPYVIKVNHSCDGTLFVRTNQDINKERIVLSIREQLRYNHGHKFRQWGYLDIPPRVLIERMIEVPGHDTPEDYKFYVYHGHVHLIEVHVDRFKSHTMNTYDRDWRFLPVYSGYPNTPRPIAKPLNLEQMITIAEKIGGQFDFARVDLYSPPQGILFGEVTFYPGAGLEIYSDEFDEPWKVRPSVSNATRFFDFILMLGRATIQSSKQSIERLTLQSSRMEAPVEQKEGPIQEKSVAQEGVTEALTGANKDFFSNLLIHEKMLADKARINAYSRAIKKYVYSDSVVLDLGTGTGILSFLAAEAGARKIFAIDHSDIIDIARSIAEKGKYESIEFIQCHSREFLPKEQADIVIHEQMGAFIDEEQMVMNILDLRRRVLRPGGRILPNIVEVYAEPVQLTERARVPFLHERNLAGIDLSYIRDVKPTTDPSYFYRRIKAVDVEFLLTEPQPLFTFDLEKLEVEDLPKSIEYQRLIIRKGRLDAICFFFRAIFDEDNSISTQPDLPCGPTSWGNIIYRNKSEFIDQGAMVKWKVTIGDHRARESWNWTRIT